MAMTRFIPAWQRRKMAEEEARRKAPPLNAHALSAIIAALGELPTETQRVHYLALLVEDGKLTEPQAAYVLRVSQGALL